MVDHTNQLNSTFAALADPTRRAILATLCDGEQTVSDLAGPFDMSLAAVSKHVGVLVRSNLVIQEKRGRERHCRLNADAMRDAHRWIDLYRRFWEGSLDSLERYLIHSKETRK